MKKNFFLQTPSKPGVLVRKTFSHTPDEARSVGLAKACVFQNIYSVIEKISSKYIIQTEWETHMPSEAFILSSSA